MLEKPDSVAESPFKSAKWDELTAGRAFSQADAPALALLCQWHAIIDRCARDLEQAGETQVAYMNDMGDLKALPQVGVLKQASAEIRALNKQLGIADEAGREAAVGTGRGNVYSVVFGNRAERRARAAR